MAAYADSLFEPVKPPKRMGPRSLFETIRVVRDNVVAAWSDDAYEKDYIPYRMFMRPVLLANHPAMIRHVLLDNAANYQRDPLGRRMLEPGLGNGLLTSEGADWKRQRRMLAPIFQPRRIQSFAPLMTERTLDLADRLERRDRNDSIDMAEAMMLVTLEIIARSMFGADGAVDVSQVGHAMEAYQTTVKPNIPDMLGFPRWFPRPGGAKGRAAMQAMDAIITDLIRRRREAVAAGKEPGSDLLGLLLAARDDENGSVLDDAEVRDQMATFFLAGHETTATALAWTWYLLANAPAVESRLHAELDTVLGGRAPGWADVEKLTYARMVIEESMRLYPPAHTTSRLAMADDEAMGVAIPKGTTVIISPFLMHRHRRWWERPDAFDPENFSTEKVAKRERFVYLPFGAGPRICIGAAFAMTEAVLILATLAQRFRFRLAPGANVQPVAKITLRPQPGLPMLAERR